MENRKYRKLVATRITRDFRASAAVVEAVAPRPGPTEVLVRNRFAGVNSSEVLLTGGVYPRGDPPFDLGYEFVGLVEEAGSGVTSVKPGDSVAGACFGGYAEVIVTDEMNVRRIRTLSAEAVAVYSNGVTTDIGLREIGQMRSGETVLVTAAAGGVGQFAVQLAKLEGNHVVAVCGTEEKAKHLRGLGCDRVVNYRAENLAEVLDEEYPSGIDLVFENVGRSFFDVLVARLAVKGRLVVCGYNSEYRGDLEVVTAPRVYRDLLWKSASVRGFIYLHFPDLVGPTRDRLLALWHEGKLRSTVDTARFEGLESVPDAVDRLLSGASTGKVFVELNA